jgi:hypothetical protein
MVPRADLWNLATLVASTCRRSRQIHELCMDYLADLETASGQHW